MNITISVSKDEAAFLTKAYTKYVNITTGEGMPVYSRSKFIMDVVLDWYSRQNLDNITKSFAISPTKNKQ